MNLNGYNRSFMLGFSISFRCKLGPKSPATSGGLNYNSTYVGVVITQSNPFYSSFIKVLHVAPFESRSLGAHFAPFLKHPKTTIPPQSRPCPDGKLIFQPPFLAMALDKLVGLVGRFGP